MPDKKTTPAPHTSFTVDELLLTAPLGEGEFSQEEANVLTDVVNIVLAWRRQKAGDGREEAGDGESASRRSGAAH